MKLPQLQDLDIQKGTPVLVRVEFNVPIESGVVSDDSRIRSALPTLEYLSNKKAKLILLAHLGRPQGWEETLSLEPVAERLGEIWNRKKIVISDSAQKLPEYAIPHLHFFKLNIEEQDITGLIDQMQPGDTAMLENIRFYPGEQANDEKFVKRLAKFGRFYVNEAFGPSHRAHASIAGLPELLPGAAGFELLREIQALERVLSHPRQPVVAMIGGVKLETKVDALKNLAKFAEYILLGGGLANIMLKVAGFEIGKSLIDEKELKLAREIWRNYKSKLKLPVDVVVSSKKDGPPQQAALNQIRSNQMILDIGPETIREYAKILRTGQTLIWNGPMGLFEQAQFRHGTFALARFFASRARGFAYGVAGGGETLQVINQLKLHDFIDHVSIGGGAMLDFLAGKKLPGIEVLLESKQ